MFFDDLKRFDNGIGLLTDIKKDTVVLGEIKSNTGLLVEGQNRMLEAQNKVVTLLQKIESKFK